LDHSLKGRGLKNSHVSMTRSLNALKQKKSKSKLDSNLSLKSMMEDCILTLLVIQSQETKAVVISITSTILSS